MATWIRPVEGGSISDSFNGHKNRAKPSVNPGTDYAVPMGTVVKAVADGTVTGIVPTFHGSGGRMIFINFSGGFNADYLHLQSIDVIKGQQVKQGQRIGLSGASGKGSENGYGPHLHFSFREGGSPTMGMGNLDFETYVSAPVATPAKSVGPAKAAAKAKAPAKPKKAANTYTVVKGDTLTKIAKAHGSTVAELVKLNGIKDKNKISIGQVLKVS
jgi:murein DD-endopeptidase MepM/ murein hydrolase activator NlpD